MSKFLHSKHNNLNAYVPGEQIQNGKYIKLNTNESPFPPSTLALKAIENAKHLNLYPDPQANSLLEAIASVYCVNKNCVAVANGSDEILAFAFQAFCGDGVPACFADISYGFYNVFADVYGINKKIIPLNDNFELNHEDYYNVNSTIFIANPNAPTGLALNLEQIENILKNNINNIVVIDEAYADFSNETAISLINKYENLLLSRTFSKSYNLAGARVGYAIANPNLINDLNLIKYSFNPYNINSLSMEIAKAAVLDRAYFNSCIQNIVRNRDYTIKALTDMGFDVLNSKTNFVFAKKQGVQGEYLYTKLKLKNILVRHFNQQRINDYIRISIGTMNDMQNLLSALRSII